MSNDFSSLKSLLSLAKIDNLEQNFTLANTETSTEVKCSSASIKREWHNNL